MTTPNNLGTGDFTDSIVFVPADLLMGQAISQVIGPNTQVSFGPNTMTSPSYTVAMDAILNANASPGILRVRMIWSDSNTGLTVGQQTWYVTGSTGSPGPSNSLTTGRGPTEADTLTLLVANLDTSHSVTVDVGLWQNSRVVTRHDWRGITQGPLPPGFTTPKIVAPAGVLGYEGSFSIGAASGVEWQCSLYAGQAQLFYQLSTAANVSLQVLVPLPDASGSPLELYYATPPAAAQGTLYLSLPRCPVIVSIANSGGVALTGQWSLMIQEFAS